MLRQYRPLRPGRKLKKGGDRTRLSPNWESKRGKMAFSQCWPIDRLYVYKRSRGESTGGGGSSAGREKDPLLSHGDPEMGRKG